VGPGPRRRRRRRRAPSRRRRSALEFELERVIWTLRRQDPSAGSRQTHRRLAGNKRKDIRSLLHEADAAPRALIEPALADAEQAAEVRNLLFRSVACFDPVGCRVGLARTKDIEAPDAIAPEYLDLTSVSAAAHAAERARAALAAARKQLQRPRSECMPAGPAA
jgi:hypothetical protein